MSFHHQDALKDQRMTPVALLERILAQVAEDCVQKVRTQLHSLSRIGSVGQLYSRG